MIASKQLIGTAVFVIWCMGAQAQQHLSFGMPAWSFGKGANHQLVQHMGHESLLLKGEATFQELEFEEGVLEVDIAAAEVRSFAALTFWVQPEGSYEEVYLRMHKSGQPDALQYSPVYQHESTWQLYANFQAAAPLYPDRWNHLKLLISGDSMQVYLNDHPTPVIEVNRLRTGFRKGKIGLRSLGGAYFANLSVEPRPHSPTFSNQAVAPLKAGVVPFWYISAVQPAPAQGVYPVAYAREKVSKVPVEEEGLLPINRWVKKEVAGNFEANPEEVVYARLIVYSEQAQTKLFMFDFSDKATVFLNQQPLFSGNNSFRAKGPLFRGDMLPDANQLYLPLQKGENEVLVAVVEKANGWALTARFSDMNGIRFVERKETARSYNH